MALKLSIHCFVVILTLNTPTYRSQASSDGHTDYTTIGTKLTVFLLGVQLLAYNVVKTS